MFSKPPPQVGGFSLIELLVVIVILAILASIAIPSYINYRTKAMVASYALPILRACMNDIASYCSAEARDEVYNNPLGDPRFPNCKENNQVAGGNVKISVLNTPVCSNSGLLSQGVIVAYIEGAENYKAYCTVDVRPFRCYIE